MGESLILDVAVGDDTAFATGAGDRRCARVGLHCSGIAETGSVVAYFGKHSGRSQRTQTGKAQQNFGIGVFVEFCDGRGGEFLCCGTGGVELS